MEKRGKPSLEAKMETLAKIIDGHIVHDETRVAVCIKGTLLGFPATLEAISPAGRLASITSSKLR